MPIVGIETYQDKKFNILWYPGGDNRPYSAPKTMAKDNMELETVRLILNTEKKDRA